MTGNEDLIIAAAKEAIRLTNAPGKRAEELATTFVSNHNLLIWEKAVVMLLEQYGKEVREACCLEAAKCGEPDGGPLSLAVHRIRSMPLP